MTRPAPKDAERNIRTNETRPRRQKQLNDRGNKCTTSKSITFAASVKTFDVEAAAGSKETALRLICRALIRLYLHDCEGPTHGERLGVL